MAFRLLRSWGAPDFAWANLSRPGDWYHQPKDYPAAYVDAHGYLPFASRVDFERWARVTSGVTTGNTSNNVGVRHGFGGISSCPGYVLTVTSQFQPTRGMRPYARRDEDGYDFHQKGCERHVENHHDPITNILQDWCAARAWRLWDLPGRFDALIQEYRPDRDLLVEVCGNDALPKTHEAIGQLADYIHDVPRPRQTDRAVLYPHRPGRGIAQVRGARALAGQGILTLWVGGRTIRGMGRPDLPG